MPFDSARLPPVADASDALRLHVRSALAGWAPRAFDPPGGWRPLSVWRAMRALLRRPLSDKQPRLC